MRGTLILLNKWDNRFLDLAQQISTWSKDPSRKIGCVAVGINREILAQGYNGFPRGIADLEYRYENRELKYKYVVHAEMNCIYNAGYNGVSLKGSTLYIYGLPVCYECAKAIIQVGIKRVVSSSTNTPERWIESTETTKAMFEEAKIIYERADSH
jgi:dCMP deaminase